MHDLERRSIRQFDRWAQDYDQQLYWAFYLSNRALATLLDPDPGTSFLDVGCGTGILLQQLHHLNRGLTLHGVDISPEMLRVARAKLQSVSVKLEETCADALPFEGNSFDYVSCANSFHHHPHPLESLKRCGGCLSLAAFWLCLIRL